MTDFLVHEDVLISLDEDLKRLIRSESEVYAVDPGDDLYGVALRRHFLFSRWPALLSKSGLQLTNEQILYNSYYWMRSFAKLHTLKHGYDAGLEQQVFMLLERADCDVDWEVIERIDHAVGKQS